MQYLSFDIECIEGQFKLGNLCEFGYVLADENFNIIEQENILIKPVKVPSKLLCKLPFSYSMDEYVKAPPFEANYDKIKSLLERKDTIVVGHAIHNDVYCVNRACAVHDLAAPNYKYVDSQIVYAVFKGKTEIMSLDKIAEELEIDFVHHRADEDARVALMTIKRVLEETKLDFKALLKYYSIKLGATADGESTACSAMHVNTGAPSVDSKNSKRRLLAMYIASLDGTVGHGGRFAGKKFHLVVNEAIGDLNRARGIVKFMYDEGARSVNLMKNADIIIGTVENPAYMKKKDIYDIADFAGRFNLPVVHVDDKKELQRYHDFKKASIIKDQREEDAAERRRKANKLRKDNGTKTADCMN